MAAQNQNSPSYQNSDRTALSTCNIAGVDFGLDVEFFEPEGIWDNCSVISGVATIFYPENSSGSAEVCVDLPNGNSTTAGLRLYNRGDFDDPTVIGSDSRICQTVNYDGFDENDLGFVKLSFYVFPVRAPSDPGDQLVDGITASLTLPNNAGNCSINNGLGIGFMNRNQVRPGSSPTDPPEDVTYNIPNGANLSDLIDDSWLLKFQSPAVSANRSVTIILDGILNVDVDYTLGQANGSLSTLTLLGGSRINVKDGNTLRIREVEIAGCRELWDAIVVENDATLILEETIITNGEKAITVEDGGNLIVRNAEFKNNHVGIFSPNDPNDIARQRTDISVLGSNFDFRVGSGLNTEDVLFSPDPVLLNPRFGEIPRAGAELNDIGNVAVFANGGINSRRNEFKNIANGLILNESKVSISGSEFDNIPSVLGQGPAGNGVLVTGDTRNARTYRVMIESDDAVTGGRGKVDFTRMETAVRVNRGAEVQVLGTTMNFVENGLVSSEAGRIRFYENDVTTTQYGFVRFGPGFFGRSYVRDNSFLAQSLPAGVLDPSAIRLVGGSNFGLQYHSINDNDIILDGAVHGILSTAVDVLRVDDNVFNWEAGKMFGTHAVTVNGGQRPRVTGNLIEGVAGDPFTETDGIRMFMTDRPTIGCNTFNNVETHLTFFGNNQRADVRGNNFLDGGIGLKYGDPLIANDPTFTGPQIHRANRWVGPFQGPEAAFYNAGLNDLDFSRYTVDTDDDLSFLPTSFNPGAQGWFINDFGSNESFYTCPSGTPPSPNNLQGGNVIEHIVDGTYNPSNTWQATQWLADSRVQRAFAREEFTAQTYAGWQQYKDELAVVEAGDHQEVESLLSVLSAADVADYEIIDSLNDEGATLQRHYATATAHVLNNGSINAVMDLERKKLLLNLAEVDDSIAVHNSSLLVSVTQDFTTAKSLNGNFSSSSILPAKNQEFINALIIEVFEQGKDAAAFDAKSLKEIAVQCPLDGGEAVYQARALAESLGVQYNQSDIDDCRGGSEKNFSTGVMVKAAPVFRVYPNPAQHVLNFAAGESPIVRFDLLDINGRIVMSNNYSNNPQTKGQVNVANVKPGAYLAKTLLVDGNVKSELVVIK